VWGIVWLVLLLLFCLFAPNTQEFMASAKPVRREAMGTSRKAGWWFWHGRAGDGFVAGVIAGVSLLLLLAAEPAEFIYFRF
jgi:hypothetical protein